MTTHALLELLGYVASALVAVSLMMRSLLRLRLINLVGSAAFATYGFLIGAYPVAVVNTFIALINIYYLRGMLQTKQYFRVLEVQPDSEYLGAFLDHYRSEIQRFQPNLVLTPEKPRLTLFVLRDLVPAGVFVAERRGPHTLVAELDFVIPAYRDFKTGHFLFHEQADFFRARGITEILSPPGSAEHTAYLRRMGFLESEGGMMRLPLG